MNEELIYVFLPDEAVDVWRPVKATRLGPDTYRIAEQPYATDIERWEFEPGDTVICERVSGESGLFLAAVRRA